ncbi:MAG TPA: amidase [Burkholderiaceae bacterium]|nr:amidase [Burkholderiaceae bacterium]
MTFFLDALDNCRSHEPAAERDAKAVDRMQAIRTRNTSIRAFVHVADSPVLDHAAQANPASLLAGVPIAVKDLIDVAGMPTRLGSRAVARVATGHAPVIASLLKEGAVIAGKSHTTEFAMSGWGVSPLGRPLNPIDAGDEYFPGGSSNGSASAVASGLVPAALGTDTGGSVRIPSSWCGITGLKGSPGWVSTQGVAALSQSFDVVGPMARSADDAGRVYRTMLPAARRKAFEEELERAARGQLPTLVFLDDASLGSLDPEVLAAYRASQAHCERLGFPTEMKPIPFGFAEMAGIWAGISSVEGYLNNRIWADDPLAPLEDGARNNLLQGGRIGLEEYFSLLNRARSCREHMEGLLIPGRLLLVPTTSTAATRLAEFDGQRTLGIYTRFVNLIQGCSIAVPNGFTADGRPTSMQFVGSHGRDAAIVHAATYWQAHTDWHGKATQLHAEQMKNLPNQPSRP